MAYNADEERGRAALREFHNYAVSRYPSTYKYSFDELIKNATAQKSAKFLLEGLGLAINSIGMSDSKVKSAMQAMADKGKGKLPADWNSWFTVLKDAAVNVTFLEAASYTVTESAKDIAKGAAEIGDTVLTTGKSILAVMPITLLAAFLFIVYRKAKSI